MMSDLRERSEFPLLALQGVRQTPAPWRVDMEAAWVFYVAATLPTQWLAKDFWFFINCTVIFPLLQDNPAIHYFRLEHER
jgi:hypothetical protein